MRLAELFVFVFYFQRNFNIRVITILLMIIRYIASDCDAVSIIHDAQGYAKTPEDAVVAVLKAGMRPTSLMSSVGKYTKMIHCSQNSL
jgi:hypothetical protein